MKCFSSCTDVLYIQTADFSLFHVAVSAYFLVVHQINFERRGVKNGFITLLCALSSFPSFI